MFHFRIFITHFRCVLSLLLNKAILNSNFSLILSKKIVTVYRIKKGEAYYSDTVYAKVRTICTWVLVFLRFPCILIHLYWNAYAMRKKGVKNQNGIHLHMQIFAKKSINRFLMADPNVRGMGDRCLPPGINKLFVKRH